MKGIAPGVLATQVSATCAWALSDAASAPAATVRSAEAIEAEWVKDPQSPVYFRMLLAAHYLTVGTFCPTDVDTRIRHHYWMELDPDRFAAAIAEVDAVAALDPRSVSARVVMTERGPLSGHDGEWFSVRAGALGRALSLGRAADVERLATGIEEELAREAASFTGLLAANDFVEALRAATVLAHNAGDLSRVVEEWPQHPAHSAERTRFTKLGHAPDRSRFGGAFFLAGVVNKSITATENHRFLALRKAKQLRDSRELLLPIGPFFEEWGTIVAKRLDEEGRVAVVDALLETHLRGTEQQGVLRALRGIAESSTGPWSRIVAALPVRLRKVVAAGDVPNAMRVRDDAFRARIEKRYRASLEEARVALRL